MSYVQIKQFKLAKPISNIQIIQQIPPILWPQNAHQLISPHKKKYMIKSMDWKIGKCRRYFVEISVIGRHGNDKRHRLSIDGKIGQKSTKSPIYRRNIGEAPKNWRKIAIFPTSPARAVVFFSLAQKSWI